MEPSTIRKISRRRSLPPSTAGVAATLASAGVLLINLMTEVDEPAWLTFVGLTSLTLAALFAFPPFLHLKRYGAPRERSAYYSTTRVVDKGLYSVVRHPQYLGYSMLVTGFTCLDPTWGSIVLCTCSWLLFYIQAVSEERYCSTHLGSDYDQYMKRVPRFNFVLGALRLARQRLG